MCSAAWEQLDTGPLVAVVLVWSTTGLGGIFLLSTGVHHNGHSADVMCAEMLPILWGGLAARVIPHLGF